MQKKWKFLLPRMLQDKYRNCCKFLAFFLQIGSHFSCIFCISILAIKTDLHFDCIVFAIFLHPDFLGSIFQLHLFAFFLQNIFFTVFQKEAAARQTCKSCFCCHFHHVADAYVLWCIATMLFYDLQSVDYSLLARYYAARLLFLQIRTEITQWSTNDENYTRSKLLSMLLRFLCKVLLRRGTY